MKRITILQQGRPFNPSINYRIMKQVTLIFLLVILQLTHADCSAPAGGTQPPGYDLSKPALFSMPAVLEEISGIAFHHGNADTVFAEQDEEGKLFYFHLGDTKLPHTRFAKRGDYEDLAICNNHIIMLRSDGLFVSFAIGAIGSKETEDAKEQPGLLPEGEYESLYADENKSRVYVLCKNCSNDKAGQSITGHILSVDAGGGLQMQEHFSVDEKRVAALAGKEKIRFKASGFARHPVTHQWYILSSVNKLLLITDDHWQPLSVYPLSPVLFTQPEGIAFDGAGNLYTANEKGSAAAGSILKFSYRQDNIKK